MPSRLAKARPDGYPNLALKIDSHTRRDVPKATETIRDRVSGMIVYAYETGADGEYQNDPKTNDPPGSPREAQ